VYLPSCYAALADRYPAVYLLHGYPYDETHWDDLGADEVAADGMANRGWPEFLVVMPRLPDPIFRSSDGGPGSYEAEMLEGLIPFIDRTYRTVAEPAGRAIVGISRGGIWALEIGFRHPEVFGTVAALSPSLTSNYPRPPYDPFNIVASGAVLPGRIALYSGDHEAYREAVERLSASLDERGVSHILEIVPGRHEDPTWQGLLPTLFEFLAAGWSSTP
jgi:enterochelin esterase-like enzyme